MKKLIIILFGALVASSVYASNKLTLINHSSLNIDRSTSTTAKPNINGLTCHHGFWETDNSSYTLYANDTKRGSFCVSTWGVGANFASTAYGNVTLGPWTIKITLPSSGRSAINITGNCGTNRTETVGGVKMICCWSEPSNGQYIVTISDYGKDSSKMQHTNCHR